MKTNNIKIVLVAFASLFFMQCDKVLDKDILDAISETTTWSDETLATAFLNRIYEESLPGWPTNEDTNSDNVNGGEDYMYGQLNIESRDTWRYETIRSINLLLRDVGSEGLAEDFQNTLKGPALFFRAWEYWRMVRLYGGVPLVLKPFERTDDLELPRSSTSDCIAQIVADLDAATALLPNTSANGEISRAAALALKGRVLLHYASEQFSPSQPADRWQAAYDANKTAKTQAEADGNALHASFSSFWTEEMNSEVIFVTRYGAGTDTKSNNREACTRPLDEAQNCTGSNQPTLSLVNSFPMKNGLPITDIASGYNPNAYWLDRDPRFDASIGYNGLLWELSGKTNRRQWNYQTAPFPPESGFYCRKAIDESLTAGNSERSGMDWVEIRFAEVLLNLAEAANEIGQTAEAYNLLYQIRARAGIEEGSGTYGLQVGMTQSELRDAILLERRLEFFTEDKRGQDIRRRRMFGMLNGTKRQGIEIQYLGADIGALEGSIIAGTINLDTDYLTHFSETQKDIDISGTINIPDNYYFFAIPTRHIETNTNLSQTDGWGTGGFDPLQ